MNLNQSETNFSIRINPSSYWSKPNFQSELIRMNPRSEWFVLILINLINLIRFNPRQLSEWIWTNPKPSFQSESIRARIDPTRIFNQNYFEIGIIRSNSDWKFGSQVRIVRRPTVRPTLLARGRANYPSANCRSW